MKPCIIVIDDDESILEVTGLILSENGYDVRTGTTEQELYQAIHECHPDLILMDVWLAQNDGNRITQKLKDNPKTADIPVILFSALNTIESLTKQAGADGFVRKPYEMNTLLTVMETHIKRPRITA